MLFWPFLTALHFGASIVSKVESEPKHEEKTFFEGFSSNTKNALYLGSKVTVFETQISNVFVCACSLM